MASVWVAEHLGLRTKVVVKLISEQLARQPEIIARFSREAASAAAVKSPHVVQMIDHGVLADGVPFIAMELLDGQDLGHRLAADRALPPRQVARIVSQVAKALARAHASGVVHRDIKPDNIFLADGGGGEAFVKVLDFGIAKTDNPHALGQTRTGAVLGTPYYMSPEQVVGSKTIDHRTDLWSLAVVAFEALAGKRPFEHETFGGLALAICQQPLPRLPELSDAIPASTRAALDTWFVRACARDVGARFASAKELADAFEAAAGGSESVPFVHAAHRGADGAAATQPFVSDPAQREPLPTAYASSDAKLPPTVAVNSRPTTTGGVSDASPYNPAKVEKRGRMAVAAVVIAVVTIGAVAVGIFVGRSSQLSSPGVASATSASVSASAPVSASPPPVAEVVDAGSSEPVRSSTPAASAKVAGRPMPLSTKGAATTSSSPLPTHPPPTPDPFGTGRR